MPVPSKKNVARFRDRAVPDKEGMTQKQYLFCEYYLKFGDASKAAVKAGYSANSKYSLASQLLSNPKVKAYLMRARRTLHANFLMTQEEALRRLSQLARGKAKEEIVVTEGAGDGYSNAKVITKKVDGRVQFQALNKVIELLKDTPQDNGIGEAKTLDDKLHEQLQKHLLNQASEINAPDNVVYEEDGDEDADE